MSRDGRWGLRPAKVPDPTSRERNAWHDSSMDLKRGLDVIEHSIDVNCRNCRRHANADRSPASFWFAVGHCCAMAHPTKLKSHSMVGRRRSAQGMALMQGHGRHQVSQRAKHPRGRCEAGHAVPLRAQLPQPSPTMRS